MNLSGQQYKRLEERLKTYYPECRIVLQGEKMQAELPLGRFEIIGCHVAFFALGEPFGELDFKDDAELYEGLEAYILVLKEEEKRCNPTLISTLKKADKRCRMTLYAIVPMMLLAAAAYSLLDLPKLLLIIALLLTLCAPAAARLVRQYSLHKDWVCPNCGAGLPMETKQWFALPKSVANCPLCGCSLLEQSLIEQLKHTTFSKSANEPKPANPPCKKAPKETQAVPGSKVPLPGSRRVCTVLGVAILIFALLFGALMFVDIDKADPTVTSINTVTLLLTGTAGVFLMRFASHKKICIPTPEIAVYKQKSLPAMAVITGTFGLFVLFASFVFSSEPTVDDGLDYVIVFSIQGLILVGLSVLLLLIRMNRSLLIYDTYLVYTTSFGRTRRIELSQLSDVRITANNSIQFFDQDGKKFCSIDNYMPGALQVIDWIDKQKFNFTTEKSTKKQAGRNSHAPLFWRDEYHTPMHDHLDAIRIGLIPMIALLIAGNAVPYLLYLFTDFKIIHAIYLTTFSALPFVVYFLIFAPVFWVPDIHTPETEEWKSMHIKFPSTLVLIFSLLLFGQVYYFWEERILQIVDFGRFFLFSVCITAVLQVLLWIRTPKYLHDNNAFPTMFLNLIMLGFIFSYGINLAISEPVKHYPAVVVERSPESGKETDRSLTVRMDDGSLAQLNVSQEIYDLQAAGVEFIVCQKENPLGIRMARLHLPEGTDLSSLPESDKTAP